MNLNNQIDWSDTDHIVSNDTRYVSLDGSWWRESSSWQTRQNGSPAFTRVGLTRTRRTKNGETIPGFSEDFDYDPIGNRRSSATYNERGEAQTSTYTANNLNQYTSRTTPGYAAVRGEADPNAFISINGNEAYRLGSYYFGSDLFDNTAAGGLANLETYAVLREEKVGGGGGVGEGVDEESDDLVSVETNQVYIAQSPETFAYDDDGNQTLITTKTGLWRVTYNGENRPIRWVRDSDNTTLTMSYDHLGRRREKNAQRFFYDGYLQVADNAGNVYTWDPTERVATRPLAWRNSALNTPSSALYYAHDGNKNVSEIIGTDDTMAAHYEYAPFGAVTAQRGESAAANPWRFSSEYSDDDTATVYYNYRPYEPAMGRWLMRDPAGESGGVDVYAFCGNKISVDINGLGGICDDFSAMSNEVWPPPPGGWAAYVESQRIERERQATENALPNFSLVVGVSGPRNFPIGGGWGISITTDISWKFGTCCDKDNKRKNFRKLIGKISAGPYVGFAPPFVLPKLKPLEVPVGYIGACPEPGETYDGFLSFQFSVGGPYVGCSYSFKDRKWSCGAGFTFEKITDIKLVTEGGVSYEVATIY